MKWVKNDWTFTCPICGKHRGGVSDHKACSAELQILNKRCRPKARTRSPEEYMRALRSHL